jgi:starvation-inducible outer membrane lipoprotein
MMKYLLILLAVLLSSCSSPPKPMSMPPPPYKVCADEDSAVTGCKKNSPSGSITIRGHHETTPEQN